MLVFPVCTLVKWKNLTRMNVILKRVFCLLVPPIYPLLCKGYRNEDCRYALLLLAMEVVSFILDLLGGSHWGYPVASFLLSVLIFETTIYAYFNKISRIKLEAQQLIAVEIVFSVVQLIISCHCLIKTLSGVKTIWLLQRLLISSLVFPLAYATTSVVFTFKSKNADELELNSIRVDPSDTPVDNVGIPTSHAKVDSLDPSLVSVPTRSDDVPQANILRKRCNTDELDLNSIIGDPSDTPVDNIDPLDQSFVSIPTSHAKVDPLDPSLVSVPARSDDVPQANILRKCSNTDELELNSTIVDPSYTPADDIDALDQSLGSISTSHAKVDPLDSSLVSVPTCSDDVPQANTLRKRKKQSLIQELVSKVDLRNNKAKKKAMKTFSQISGVIRGKSK